jgi:hypothetical protein
MDILLFEEDSRLLRNLSKTAKNKGQPCFAKW